VSRTLRSLVFVLLLAAGCGRAENSLLLLDDLPDVESITIEGCHAFSEKTVKSVMITTTPDWWNPFGEQKYRKGQLKSDLGAILTFYYRHGYLRAEIVDEQIRRSGNKVHILIRIQEGEPVTVRDVVIVGARSFNPNDIQKKLALKRGRPLDIFQLQEDRRLILRTLSEQGYWEAKVEADVQFFGQEGVVFYILTEGSPVEVRSITVEGLTQVRPKLAYEDISVKEGQLLRYKELERSQIRLLQTGYFADAQWDTTGLDTLTHQVSVGFTVRERRLQWVEAGIGLSSQENLNFTLGWGTRNFLNSGLQFGVRSQTSLDLTDRLPSILDEHTTQFTWSRTRLFRSPWEGRLTLAYVRDNEVAANDAPYSQDILGARLAVQRNFQNLRSQTGVALESRWVNNHASEGARLSDPQLYLNSYLTRILSGWVEWIQTNDFFSPTRGGIWGLRGQLAGGSLGGNNGFESLTGGVRRYVTLPGGGGWVLATRLRLGNIWTPADSTVGGRPITTEAELVPTDDRYYAGGANTVRGYQQDGLDGTVPITNATDVFQAQGGVVQYLLNVELRFPVLGKLGGVLFLDSGNVWQDADQFGLNRLVPTSNPASVSPFDVRYTYGFGIRYASPVGPIRVDFAWPWNLPAGTDPAKEQSWYVALGQSF